MDIIQLNDQIEEFVQKNNLSEDALTLKKENAISNSAEWQRVLSELAETERVLRIGIIGRVKAGKSSLLNALLFNGQDILPKAATPMTAALTVMEYSENVRAEVEFFTEADITDIRKEYESYLESFEEKKPEAIKKSEDRALRNKRKKTSLGNAVSLTNAEKAECEKKAISSLEKDMRNEPCYASYDQYERIKKSGRTLADLNEYRTIEATSIEDLMSKLNDFVGSNGSFMPFTKAVKLYIPHEGLKGLQIIDTPGLNDPVTSRGSRTEEMLQHCDAVLVVSPSGQFLSTEDTDLLSRITTKEGTQEAYLIASQVDNQLFGSERGNATDPVEVFEKISTKLTAYARNVLQKQVAEHPEMKVSANKLSQNNVICSSSIAYAMQQRFDERHSWDENLKHVWNNLATNYPEKFRQDDTALNTLNKLANIETVHNVFSDVNARKKEILQRRKVDFENAKRTALKAYLDGLNTFITNRIQQIESADVAELKEQKRSIEKQQEQVKTRVGDVYDDLISDVKLNLHKQMRATLTAEIRRYTQSADKAQGMDSYEETYLYKKAPFLLSWFLDDEYRTRTVQINTVNATMVNRVIREVRSQLGNNLNDISWEFQKIWKKDLYKNVVKTLREIMGDDAIDVEFVNRTLKNILATIPEPEFKIQSAIPSILQKTGLLKGSDVEKFNAAAENYIYSLEDDVASDIKSYISTYQRRLKNIDLAVKFIGDLDNNLSVLMNEIENKESSLFYYNKLKNELEKLKQQVNL